MLHNFSSPPGQFRSVTDLSALSAKFPLLQCVMLPVTYLGWRFDLPETIDGLLIELEVTIPTVQKPCSPALISYFCFLNYYRWANIRATYL